MMFAYFRQLPKSLEDAALVDGCTRWQALWSVAIPLAVPGIVAAAGLRLHRLLDRVLLRAASSPAANTFTLPTVFRAFLGFQGAQYGEASALAIVSLVPSIALGILVQRHLVRGLTLGAVRG